MRSPILATIVSIETALLATAFALNWLYFLAAWLIVAALVVGGLYLIVLWERRRFHG